MKYSIIIPVFNRPNEVEELLESLTKQNSKDFEVIVVDDGSTTECSSIIPSFNGKLTIQYFRKENTGQGFTRNWAAEKAKGDYLVFFDSDCIIPPDYFVHVNKYLEENSVDSWGGGDKAHPDFTLLQKAVGYTMSSLLTTGGIRGKSKLGKFQPRSFNMGMKKSVFLDLDGFKQTNMGEDIELSTRVNNNGYNAHLIADAYVYHKRRDTVEKFYKQVYNFGRGRIINSRKNRTGIKLLHLFPLFFTLGFFSLPLITYFLPLAGGLLALAYLVYLSLILIFSTVEYRSLLVGIISVPITVIQFLGYAVGMVKEAISSSN